MNDMLDNEREWRQFLIKEQGEIKKEIKELKHDLNIFKFKVLGFISALVAAVEAWKNLT